MAFALQTADGADIGASESWSHTMLLARLAGPPKGHQENVTFCALRTTGKRPRWQT
jgi:hypothetical protein